MISCFSFNMIKLLLFSDKVRAKYKIFSAVPGTFRVWQFFCIFLHITVMLFRCRSPPSRFWNLFKFQNFGGKHGSERFLFIHRWETR